MGGRKISREEAAPKRRPKSVAGPPMTLANMREHLSRELLVYCLNPNCRHTAVLNVDDYADDVPVRWFGPRMVCTGCGVVGADARPNWRVGGWERNNLDA